MMYCLLIMWMFDTTVNQWVGVAAAEVNTSKYECDSLAADMTNQPVSVANEVIYTCEVMTDV